MNPQSQSGSREHIYWANALFTQADRSFNAHCAEKLRQAGYKVFLPQEAAVNKEAAPSAKEIFRVDTSAILNSSLMIVCLDQETIDSGVACEIGLAFAFNIPMIGLYTDVRQFREGPGRMYKNLYTIGAIETFGQIVTSLDDLINSLPQCLLSSVSKRRFAPEGQQVVQHYSDKAGAYDKFIKRLETWYRPTWNSMVIVDRWMREFKPLNVLEIGCGTGTLSHRLCANYPITTYVGYDPAVEMIELARSSQNDKRCFFTADIREISTRAKQASFDIALALFTLHDHPVKEETLVWMIECLRPKGVLGLVDLSTEDLPVLTDQLRRGLARPAYCMDTRLGSASIAAFVQQRACDIVHCDLALPQITFASANDLLEYLEIFGIFHGMDLPLGLEAKDHSATKVLIQDLISGWPSHTLTNAYSFPAC